MSKTLRVPERLFRAATWFVSALFAAFLIGFGGLVIADLPKVEGRLELEAFAHGPTLTDSRERQQSARASINKLTAERDMAFLNLRDRANAYQAGVAQHENWLKTRVATTNAAQDQELVERTLMLDELKKRERTAQQQVERLDGMLLSASSELLDAETHERRALTHAQAAFDSALEWQRLRVFLWRLAVTLPLLVAAWWFAARKRQSDYWLLYRGFLGFAIFTFFVELVPYLPSYGGYVRYGVGIVLTAVLGHYTIKGMRAYLAKRREAEQRSEIERRRELSPDAALKKMEANQCPGCERPIMGGEARPDFCVHCGLKLFESCPTCSTRKNAFFQFCAKCGTRGTSARAA